MGGCGSGGWNKQYQATIEEVPALDIDRLNAAGALTNCRPLKVAWQIGAEPVASALMELIPGAVRLVMATSHRAELIPFGWTPCRFGGHRPHFTCPLCARRCRKLYGVPRMVCRQCLGLPYKSTRRRLAGRQFDQANVIRTALGGAPGCVQPFPLRPHGMHKTTYARLRHRALALEDAALAHYAAVRRLRR